MMRGVSVFFAVCGVAVALPWSEKSSGVPEVNATQGTPGMTIAIIHRDNRGNALKGATAVRPVLEIRDVWNLPIAGAQVVFKLPKGRPSAVFGKGLLDDPITIDALGCETVDEMMPIRKGTFSIDVRECYGGNTASAAIEPANLPTVVATQPAVKLPSMVMALAITTKILLWLGVASDASAGLAAAIENGRKNRPSLYNTFTADLNAARNTLPVGSTTPRVAASQNMFSGLDSHCACEGGLGQLASNSTPLAELNRFCDGRTNVGAVANPCGLRPVGVI